MPGAPGKNGRNGANGSRGQQGREGPVGGQGDQVPLLSYFPKMHHHENRFIYDCRPCIQKDYTQGPMGVLGWGAVSYERGSLVR